MLDINFAQVFLSFVVLLFALTVHETAHAWMADRLGDPTGRLQGRVSLNPLVHADLVGTVLVPLLAWRTGFPPIGWTKPVPVLVGNLRRPRRDAMLVAAAGPAANLLLAVAAAALLRVWPVSPVRLGEANMSVPIASLLSQAMRINVLLAVLNLIPIPPLDAGNAIGWLLPEGLARGFARVQPYGFLLISALMLTGGLQYLVVPPYHLLVSWLP